MTSVKIRPTFSMLTELGSNDVMRLVHQAVENEHDSVTGEFTDHHAMISIAESKRHFWSPWLHLEVRDEADSAFQSESDQDAVADQEMQNKEKSFQTTPREIFGRFSPHPSIWTAIMFSYLSLAVLFFFSIVVGLSQQLCGFNPWGYYLLPAWLVIAILLWVVSQAGQKLAHAEMDFLKDLVSKCVAKR